MACDEHSTSKRMTSDTVSAMAEYLAGSADAYAHAKRMVLEILSENAQ